MCFKIKLFYLCLVAFIPAAVKSQDIKTATIRWKVDQLTDLSIQQDFPFTCTFVTHGQDSIQWQKASSVSSFALGVQTMDGKRTDVTAQGQDLFNIAIKDQTGTIKFQRNQSGAFITLLLNPTQSNGINHRYRVTEVKNN